MAKLNILMIAFEFPPLNTGGSHRPYKFAKNLGNFGIHPIVVTPSIETLPGIDQSITIENDLKIIRTHVDASGKFDKILESNYFTILDSTAKKWKKHVLSAVENILSKEKLVAVYVTAPPFSILKLGVFISQKYNLPLIADMRDAWSNWVITPYASYLHYLSTKKLERNLLSKAHAIISTSDQTNFDFQKLHPDIPAEKFHLITNAFEGAIPDYQQNKIQIKEVPIRIGYVGSFYYDPYQRDLIFNPWWKKKIYQYFQYAPHKEDWLYRSPYFLFKCLSFLQNQHPDLEKLLNVEFIGLIPDWLPKMIKEFNLEKIVILHGKKSHQEALQFQADMDMLFLTSAKVLEGDDYSIAGKTYEYISNAKPILAFVCEGAQKRILEKTGLSVICNPDDTEASAKKISSILNGTIELKPDIDFIKTLHISSTSKQLAEIIKKIV